MDHRVAPMLASFGGAELPDSLGDFPDSVKSETLRSYDLVTTLTVE
jgi:hypothetical protein